MQNIHALFIKSKESHKRSMNVCGRREKISVSVGFQLENASLSNNLFHRGVIKCVVATTAAGNETGLFRNSNASDPLKSRCRAPASPNCGLVIMFLILRCRQCLQMGCSWSPDGCTWANAGERNVNTVFTQPAGRIRPLKCERLSGFMLIR